jgi:tetratricopeptide (TPR) repeat protein
VSAALPFLIGVPLLANTLVTSGIVTFVLVVAVGAWLLVGPGPRRGREYRRAQRLLHQGQWQDALAIVQTLQMGRLSAAWKGRLRNSEGECHHRAAEIALHAHNYEQGLDHYHAAAALLNLDATELRTRVIESMLAAIRQQFALCKSAAENQAVQQLLARAQGLQTPCPEAMFWQGLCHVREGNLDAAAAALAASHEAGGKRFLDPPLYLGALRIRAGQTQEGLRFLGEANRIDANCPLVSLQLGVGLVAANGDSGLASRALLRALGPRGLAPWVKSPDRFWVETFPEGRSYVRRLAAKHAFQCPVFSSDVAALMRQGEFALAQAEYRQGNFEEAAERYGKLLQDAPPSAPLVRGLGLSLARLGRYDQAYKHLRAALDMEEPKDPRPAGYLALCGALGKPIRDEDKARNVEWAIALLARYDMPGDLEWARINSAVFAEARKLGIAISVENQVRLCDVLAGVNAVDAEAAAAFAQFAATAPDQVRPVHAWLYCHAAHVHGFTSEQDLALFGITFRDESAAAGFYAQRKWDLEAVALTYLERCAAQRPGHFPEEFGPEFPAHGEEMLLTRSNQLEAAGQVDAALAMADVLIRLAPQSVRAHDQLAQLHYKRGEFARTVEVLAGWETVAPTDPVPVMRRAVIEQQRGNDAGRQEAIHRALERANGKMRAAIAFLGARLSLATSAWHEAADLLHRCLQEDAGHIEALTYFAAVRSILNDRAGLAAQAVHMDRPEVKEPRFHYLAALCHLENGDHDKTLEACRRASTSADSALAVEVAYLAGWAHLQSQETAAATISFTKVANCEESPSAPIARALLARMRFQSGDYGQAIGWWQAIDIRRRGEWQLDEPLRQTVLLAGLQGHAEGRYEEAADHFREAGRLGLRDRRLGGLLVRSLVMAGQRLVYTQNSEPFHQSRDR